VSALSTALGLQELVKDDPALKLLRAEHLPVVVAVLGEHLGGDVHRRPAEELYDLVDADLDELRAHLDLPLTGRAYCDAWRANGFLVRRPAAESRGETLELSPGALAAIRVVEQITTPRQAVTESRLASIVARLADLAVETDPDVTRRLAALQAQRDRLDEQISRIAAGEPTLDDRRAAERLQDILAQAHDVPADFARVRARFEQLSHDLHASVLGSDQTSRTVLTEVFRGVDLIASSDEGRTFAAFSRLVLDPAQGTQVDDAVARLLRRDFAADLEPGERRFLRRFMRSLKEHSAEIQGVVTTFARGLRRYVQSQDYQRDRALRRLLDETVAKGVAAAPHTRPYSPTEIVLELTTVPLSSIGELRLHDPAEMDATAPMEINAGGVASLEDLRAIARETEIDFAELADTVDAVLAERATATVGEVLAAHPATQGIASVVGLLTLAARHGTRDDETTETLTWAGLDEIPRRADVVVHRFTERTAR